MEKKKLNYKILLTKDFGLMKAQKNVVLKKPLCYSISVFWVLLFMENKFNTTKAAWILNIIVNIIFMNM